MQINFECQGGFANLSLVYRAHTDELPKEIAQEIVKQVDTSGYFEIQPSEVAPSAKGPPDVFTYRLSLADEKRRQSLSCTDVTAPPKLHPLLALFRELAMQEKRKG